MNIKLLRRIQKHILAERRLAMEEAAKIAEGYTGPFSEWDGTRYWNASQRIADLLRAAAEKRSGEIDGIR